MSCTGWRLRDSSVLWPWMRKRSTSWKERSLSFQKRLLTREAAEWPAWKQTGRMPQKPSLVPWSTREDRGCVRHQAMKRTRVPALPVPERVRSGRADRVSRRGRAKDAREGPPLAHGQKERVAAVHSPALVDLESAVTGHRGLPAALPETSVTQNHSGSPARQAAGPALGAVHGRRAVEKPAAPRVLLAILAATRAASLGAAPLSGLAVPRQAGSKRKATAHNANSRRLRGRVGPSQDARASRGAALGKAAGHRNGAAAGLFGKRAPGPFVQPAHHPTAKAQAARPSGAPLAVRDVQNGLLAPNRASRQTEAAEQETLKGAAIKRVQTARLRSERRAADTIVNGRAPVVPAPALGGQESGRKVARSVHRQEEGGPGRNVLSERREEAVPIALLVRLGRTEATGQPAATPESAPAGVDLATEPAGRDVQEQREVDSPPDAVKEHPAPVKREADVQRHGAGPLGEARPRALDSGAQAEQGRADLDEVGQQGEGQANLARRRRGRGAFVRRAAPLRRRAAVLMKEALGSERAAAVDCGD